MIDRAREHALAEGVANVRFEQADAQVHAFAVQEFDVVISRFGAMFFADPVAAFANIGGAMRPGARLTLLGWQELRRNPWVTAIRDALASGRQLPDPPPGQPGPFGLADADMVRGVLASAGFESPEVDPVHAPVCLGPGVDGAMSYVGGMGITRGLLADLDDTARAGALEALRATLTEHVTADGVLLDGAAWVITARRR
jgi:SAM-dependent methyltransferase